MFDATCYGPFHLPRPPAPRVWRAAQIGLMYRRTSASSAVTLRAWCATSSYPGCAPFPSMRALLPSGLWPDPVRIGAHRCYRYQLPLEFKSHSSHDILPVCFECHQKGMRFEYQLQVHLASRQLLICPPGAECIGSMVAAAGDRGGDGGASTRHRYRYPTTRPLASAPLQLRACVQTIRPWNPV